MFTNAILSFLLVVGGPSALAGEGHPDLDELLDNEDIGWRPALELGVDSAITIPVWRVHEDWNSAPGIGALAGVSIVPDDEYLGSLGIVWIGVQARQDSFAVEGSPDSPPARLRSLTLACGGSGHVEVGATEFACGSNAPPIALGSRNMLQLLAVQGEIGAYQLLQVDPSVLGPGEEITALAGRVEIGGALGMGPRLVTHTGLSVHPKYMMTTVQSDMRWGHFLLTRGATLLGGSALVAMVPKGEVGNWVRTFLGAGVFVASYIVNQYQYNWPYDDVQPVRYHRGQFGIQLSIPLTRVKRQ